jgi:hypothetical protein
VAASFAGIVITAHGAAIVRIVSRCGIHRRWGKVESDTGSVCHYALRNWIIGDDTAIIAHYAGTSIGTIVVGNLRIGAR